MASVSSPRSSRPSSSIDPLAVYGTNCIKFVGQDEDEVRTGNAMILDPYGRILVETWQADDAMVSAELDLGLLDLETKRLRDKEQAYLQQLQAEQARSERLLLNILPQPIAERLDVGAEARHLEMPGDGRRGG